MSKTRDPIMRLVAEVENQRPQRINGALVDGAVMELTALRRRAEKADALALAAGDVMVAYGEYFRDASPLFEALAAALAAYREQA